MEDLTPDFRGELDLVQRVLFHDLEIVEDVEYGNNILTHTKSTYVRQKHQKWL